MPRYDYRCPACDKVFEVEHGMRERPQITCPICGAPALRVFDASGIVLKGSGFYNTDQRGKKGATAATGAGKGGEGSSSEGSASKGDKTESSSTAGTSNTSGSDSSTSTSSPAKEA